MKKLKIYKLMTGVMTAVMLAPAAVAPVMNTVSLVKAADITAVTDPKTGLTTVTRVNGKYLTKDALVNPGDAVTYDIVYLPGNQGIMSNFTDTLPKGMAFSPQSKVAMTVYLVNADGTINNNDITNEGDTTLSDKTITWKPHDGKKYYFNGVTNANNCRLLFHITAQVESSVTNNQVLRNVATGNIRPPRSGKDVPITDSATVHTKGNPGNPNIHKSIYAQNDAGELLYPDDYIAHGTTPTKFDPSKMEDKPAGGGKDDLTPINISVSTDDSDETILANSRALIAACGSKVDCSALKEAIDGVKSPINDRVKAKIIAAFKVVANNYQVAMDAQNASQTDPTSTGPDQLTLKNKADKYAYVIDAHIPANSIKQALAISDPLENVQSFTLADIRLYDGTGQDITAQGKITEQKNSNNQNEVVWTANSAYVQNIVKANRDVHIRMVIPNVTVANASIDDLNRYTVGGQISVPNVSTLIPDNNHIPSNTTIVHVPAGTTPVTPPTPTPKVPQTPNTVKEVSVDGGKTFVTADTPEKASPVGAADHDYTWRSTFKLAGATDFNKIVLTDHFETLQTLDKDNLENQIKVFDSTGNDVTKQGKLTATSVNNKIDISWTANSDYLKDVNSKFGKSNTNGPTFTMSVTTNLKNATDDQKKAYWNDDLHQWIIPNTSTSTTSGTDSNGKDTGNVTTDSNKSHVSENNPSVPPKTQPKAVKTISTDGGSSYNSADTPETAAGLGAFGQQYTWKNTFSLANYTDYTKLVFTDHFETLQTLDTKHLDQVIHVYDASGNDITTQGKLEAKPNGKQTDISWTASDDYLKNTLNKNFGKNSSKVPVFNMTITTDLSKASKDDLAPYFNDKTNSYIIPNKSTMTTSSTSDSNNSNTSTDTDTPTNTSYVSVPKTAPVTPVVPTNPTSPATPSPTSPNPSTPIVPNMPNTPSSITKGVQVENGTSEFNAMTKQLVIPNLSASEWSKENVNTLLARSADISQQLKTVAKGDKDLPTKEITEFNDAVANLKKYPRKETAKARLVKALSTISAGAAKYNKTHLLTKQKEPVANDATFTKNSNGTVTFKTGNLTATLPHKNDAYQYLINASVNPSDVKSLLQISDPIDDVQINTVDLNNIKIYDATGHDITDQFKLAKAKSDNGHTLITATANDVLVKKVANSSNNQQFQMVINHVSLKNMTKNDLVNHADKAGKPAIYNEASLNTDNHKITSSKTKVTYPDQIVYTGIDRLKRNPLAIFSIIAVALTGIGGILWKNRYSRNHKKSEGTK